MQYLSQKSQLFGEHVVYYELEDAVLFIRFHSLISDLCPKTKIILKLGQLEQLENKLFFNLLGFDFFL
jgi:hypothetical protein